MNNNIFNECKHIWVNEVYENMYVMFRKEFDLTGLELQGQLHIFAEGRYKAFINGQEIGFGPARYEPKYKEFDSYLLGDQQLRQGRNCIAVLVHYCGRDHFSYMKDAPGLIVSLEGEDTAGEKAVVISDASWKAKIASQWASSSVKMNIQLDFEEIYDARMEEEDWRGSGFDDHQWWNANVLENNMCDFEVYHPRSIPMLKESEVHQPIVVERGVIREPLDVYFIEAGDWYDYNQGKSGQIFFYTYLFSPATKTIELVVDSNEENRYFLNGDEITYYVTSETCFEKRISKVQIQKGWNFFSGELCYFKEHWQVGFGIPSSEAVVVSSECSMEEKGTFFISDEENMEIKVNKKIFHSMKMLKSYISNWKKMMSYQNIALQVAWEQNHILRTDVNEMQLPMRMALNDEVQYILLDFGEEVFGRISFEVESQEGVHIDLTYAEHLMEKRINPIKSHVWYGDRYVTKHGIQKFTSFDVRGFRYLQLTLRKKYSDPNDFFILKHVQVKNMTYPVENRGSFVSDDLLLNKIWEMGRKTLKLCMEDAYIDCPWRERGQWWGDAAVDFLVNLVTFGDFKLMRRGILQMGRGQRADGLLPGVYPNRFLGAITDFSLIWVSSVWEYYHYSGDKAILSEVYVKMKKVVGYFIDRMDSDGLTVIDPKEWTFIDWAEIDKNGKVTAINAFLYKSLLDLASTSNVLGIFEEEAYYRIIAEKIKVSLNQFLWDEALRSFADAYFEGKRSEKFSVHSNVLMVAFELADANKCVHVIPQIKQILEENLKGNYQYLTGYFMHYVFKALEHAGEYEFAINYIKKWWGWFIERGLSTFNHYHHLNSSLCHAWSCSPTSFISQYILGIQFPYAGDVKTIRISPNFDWLKKVEGEYPLPLGGKMKVKWEKKECIRLSLYFPEVYNVVFKPPASQHVDKWKVLANGGEISKEKDTLFLRNLMHIKFVFSK